MSSARSCQHGYGMAGMETSRCTSTGTTTTRQKVVVYQKLHYENSRLWHSVRTSGRVPLSDFGAGELERRLLSDAEKSMNRCPGIAASCSSRRPATFEPSPVEIGLYSASRFMRIAASCLSCFLCCLLSPTIEPNVWIADGQMFVCPSPAHGSSLQKQPVA